MKGRTPTKDEREYMDQARELGCIVCLKFYDIHTPPAIHHTDGKTKPNAHFKVLGLCHNHHQVKDSQKPRSWVSRHGDGRPAFEAEYGTEKDLMYETIELLGNPAHVLEALE